MTARLRHLVLATDDLAGAVARARAGFGLAPGIRDAEAMRAFDAEHEVLVLGSAYLEILAPLGNWPELAASRFLARGGPGGYMLDLQVPDLDVVLGRVGRPERRDRDFHRRQGPAAWAGVGGDERAAGRRAG